MNQSNETQARELVGNWNFPTSISFGVGRIAELKTTCDALGIGRPLFVTDEGLGDMALVQDIVSSCRSDGLGAGLFTKVKPNPTGSNVEAGTVAFRAGDHDGVIALGGGSGLDAGKAIALMVGQNRPIWDFEDVGDNWRRVDVAGMAATIAVPTTAGTGSEVGRASVIVDQQSCSKKIIFHPKMLPVKVIADPQLTVGLPAPITAATGMDALVHNLEAFCAPGYHPLADGIAQEGIRLISRWLPMAVENGNDLVARSHMLIASTMGATAFQKGLGGVHALAHPLGGIFDKHHGLLNAILLPYVLRRNREAIEDRIARLCPLISIKPGFEPFFNWVIELRRRLGIPHSLHQIGIAGDRSAEIGELASKDPSAIGNPVPLTASDYSELFCHAVEGHI